MNGLRKFSLKYFFAGTLPAAFLLMLTWQAGAGYVRGSNFYSALTTEDTTKPVKKTDSLSSSDSITTDTIPAKQTDTIPVKQGKDSILIVNGDTTVLKDSLLRRDSVVTDTFS